MTKVTSSSRSLTDASTKPTVNRWPGPRDLSHSHIRPELASGWRPLMAGPMIVRSAMLQGGETSETSRIEPDPRARQSMRPNSTETDQITSPYPEKDVTLSRFVHL